MSVDQTITRNVSGEPEGEAGPPARGRLLAVVLAVVVLAGAATGYAWWSAARGEGPAAAAVDSGRSGQLVFRTSGRLAAAPLPATTAAPAVSALRCDRTYTAAGTTLCLTTRAGTPPTTDAIVLGRDLKEVRRVRLAGVPSRARVSASGRMASWTVFVTGESYNSGGFSTWSGILDTRTGYVITNIEEIPVRIDGRRYHSADVNYWGITFAADDNRFYATLGTKGKTYLVEGDFANWRARTLRENAECPSLSPDGTTLVYKKRVSPGPWRLHALDLATGRETPLAEPASIDDQAAWLDERTVMYAKGKDVWSVPADGSGAPRLLAREASSPAAVR
ncbi:TolB family protein [Nonomuraea typhae]|uniref:TolB family protein n=1 Tax=Nonomuraea typhae TaxID=2603600 RepID=A0ABW7YNU6_9ACTN